MLSECCAVYLLPWSLRTQGREKNVEKRETKKEMGSKEERRSWEPLDLKDGEIWAGGGSQIAAAQAEPWLPRCSYRRSNRRDAGRLRMTAISTGRHSAPRLPRRHRSDEACSSARQMGSRPSTRPRPFDRFGIASASNVNHRFFGITPVTDVNAITLRTLFATDVEPRVSNC